MATSRTVTITMSMREADRLKVSRPSLNECCAASRLERLVSRAVVG